MPVSHGPASHILAFAASIMFQLMTSKVYRKVGVCLKSYEPNSGTRALHCVGEQRESGFPLHWSQWHTQNKGLILCRGVRAGCQSWEKAMGEVVKRQIVFVFARLFHVTEDIMWVHHLILGDLTEWARTEGTWENDISLLEEQIQVLVWNMHFPKLLSFCPKTMLVLSGEMLTKFSCIGCDIPAVTLQCC